MAFLPTPALFPRRFVKPSTSPRATASNPDAQAASTPPDGTQDPFQRGYDKLRHTINNAFNTFYTPVPTLLPPLRRPFSKTPSSNYILHPTEKPKAVIHFLGAAFFGAAPHLLYHTLLTKLADRGYVVVATPYELSFEYLPLTERICSAWETVETDLAARYGPLPVIGLGHSAGSLFHTLSSCLFEDLSPRAGLALVSFNNRVAGDAIPGYESTVAPFARFATMAKNGLPDDVREFVDRVPAEFDDFVSGPLAPERFVEEVLPTVKEGRRFVEQLPGLVEEMGGEGVKQFYPNPEDVQKAIVSMYPVEQTLVIKFGGDSLDDSEALVDTIRRGGNDVSFVELKGSHVTPLAQEPEIGGVGGLIAEMVAGVSVGELEQMIKVLDEWVESGIANGRL